MPECKGSKLSLGESDDSYTMELEYQQRPRLATREVTPQSRCRLNPHLLVDSNNNQRAGAGSTDIDLAESPPLSPVSDVAG